MDLNLMSFEIHPVGTYILLRRDPVSDGSDSELSFGTVIARGAELTVGISDGCRVAFTGSGYSLDDERVIVDQTAIVAILR